MACYVTVLAHYNRNFEPSRHQQRFVTIFSSGSVRIDESNAFRRASITAAQDVELDAALLEHFAKHDDERCFTRSADTNVSHRNDGSAKFMCLQISEVVKSIPEIHA